ncbi:mitochondrial 50S ribosomal protein L5 [Epithele typhae]|uniref:mitochondrial 50S ribosomal protein L5 n=1 Tax=Epithele typhae TaxID=378194 RepID=UPI0020083870|nr:mitochondrial 50S ribosomal protein L5 [Epithele typhae]KAH9932703.1 mitochondrial 50S ribosomal protein L5 [Epithele typhae]
MSAPQASRMGRTATAAGRSLRRARAAPEVKPLLRNDAGYPVPHVNVIVRDTHQPRMADHYLNTVQEDVMYMSYVHEPFSRKPVRPPRLAYDPADPYVKHRYNPPLGGNRYFQRQPPPSSPDSVVRLERIQIHTQAKNVLTTRANLLGPIMALRAISGATERGGGQHTSTGVQLVHGHKNVPNWTRPGAPLGAKVDLRGPPMWDFLSVFVEFVLPRMREFQGVRMEGSSHALDKPSSASGVVSIGLPPQALSLFPQIEVNFDAYPNAFGMHIHFITNATGMGAQNRARTLLSGFQIPFARS